MKIQQLCFKKKFVADRRYYYDKKYPGKNENSAAVF